MRSIRTDQSSLAWRRHRFEVAAHITRRYSQRTQAGDLQVGKVLADSPTVLPDFNKRRGHSRGFGVVGEVIEDSTGKPQNTIDKRRLILKGVSSISSHLLAFWN